MALLMHRPTACPRRPRRHPRNTFSHIPPPTTHHYSNHPGQQNHQQKQKQQQQQPSPSLAAQLIPNVPIQNRNPIHAILSSNSVKYLIAGAIAGIVSRTAVSPLEVVATVNMCTSTATPPLLLQLRQLLQNEGMRGFFKGNAANCLKVAPTKGIQFLVFEALKRFMFRTRQRYNPSSNPNKPLSLVERFFAGGLAGITAATLCYPLDTAKTLLTAHPEKFSGVFRTIAVVARQQGPRALYRGLSPTIVAMMPYAGLDFAIYEHLKLMYWRRNNKEANLLALLFIGAFAGTVAQTACHPLDVLRKRLQLQGIAGRPVQFTSMLHAATRIVTIEGPTALYRGLQPMYISAIPSAGVSYVVYEALKKMLGVRSFQ